MQTAAATVVIRNKDDLEQDLDNELVQFAVLLQMFKEEEDKSGLIGMEHYLYQLLISKGLQSRLSNVDVVLRIYLFLMVANCSGEPSFENEATKQTSNNNETRKTVKSRSAEY